MGEAVGRHWAYYVVSLSITLVLALATRRSVDCRYSVPCWQGDNYLPHVFALTGDRQVFDYGIWALTAMSAALLITVNGNTNRLIPLFAIGVFTSFHSTPDRSRRSLVAGETGWMGAASDYQWSRGDVTAVATMIFLSTKFTEGAWVVVIAVPFFIFLFMRTHFYYVRVGKLLGIGTEPPKPVGARTQVIVPVAGVSLLVERAVDSVARSGGGLHNGGVRRRRG